MAKIEVEITSQREDGSWTWRAIGAREPKGTVDASLLTSDVTVGAQFLVETEHFIDGLVVSKVFERKQSSNKGEIIEIIGSGKTLDPVTTQLAKKRNRKSSKRAPSTKSGVSEKKGKKFSKKNIEGDNSQRETPKAKKRKAQAEYPKTKRLKAKRHYRNKALKNLPDETTRIGEILLRNGLPGLRKAISDQNQIAKRDNEPEIPEELLLKLAEHIYPDLKTAEWLDRADAAIKGIETVDLRDIRSVIVASDNVQKNDDVRSLSEELKNGFTKRVETDQNKWLKEVISTLKEGRIVRALRLSSRPPKAGFPLPEDLLNDLAEATNSALTSDVSPSRWGTLIEAAAFSPIHDRVDPQGIPSNPDEELLKIIQKISKKLPSVSEKFDSLKV